MTLSCFRHQHLLDVGQHLVSPLSCSFCMCSVMLTFYMCAFFPSEIIYGWLDTPHNLVKLMKLIGIFNMNSNKLLNIIFFDSLISQTRSKSLLGCSIDTLYTCWEVSDLHVWAGNIIQFWSLFSNLHNSSRSPCCSPMVILIPSLTSHGCPCSIIVINWLTALIDPTNPSSALMSMF